MNPVVHFELPCDDRDRVARFLEQAFGWTIRKPGREMGSDMLATRVPATSMLQPLPMGR